MSCPEDEMLIRGYLDNELDLVSALRLEAHFEGVHGLRASLRE
jgi:hypothetical protein